jgi:hypothetical protein
MNFFELLKSIPGYTEAQWQEEIKAPGVTINFPEGPFAFGTILSCPLCRTVGFYGPRISGKEGENPRKYRACKFCGLWQEAVGEARERLGPKAYRCTAVVCTNGHYNWVMPEIKKFGKCEFCQGEYNETQWAIENPSHPFQKIKEAILNSQK